MDKIWDILGMLLVVAISTIVLTIIYEVSTASGKIDFCRIEENQYEKGYPFRLTGHKSWRPDSFISSNATYEEAVERAKLIKCPIGVGP